MENTSENQVVDPVVVALADELFEHMGEPRTAKDILKAKPEIGSRKALFAAIEKLEHENLIRSSKEGTKDGHPLKSFSWWINDDAYAFMLWRRYLRDAA